MRKVLLALLGLILLAILAYFCFQNKVDTIRNDLVSTTQTALSDQQIMGLKVDLKGNETATTDIITLQGEVATVEAKALAEKTVQSISGINGVENLLRVTQSAPALAKQADTNTTEVLAAKEENQTEPKKTTLAKQTQAPQAKEAAGYTLTLTKDKENKVTLAGLVNDKKMKQTLLEKANKLFGKKNVTDELKVSEHAPKDWQYISTFALDRLHDVDYGDMKLQDNSYIFTGHLPSPSTKAAFLDGIRTVMSDPENHYGKYRGDYIITAPVEEPAALTPKTVDMAAKSCQQKIDKVLKDKKILFDYNKASLKKESYILLGSVIEALKPCKITKLLIAGHTDNTGDNAYNKILSTKRAESVRHYLIKKGFKAKTLDAVGYGETKPIASNKTKKGRAENRRIEFIIKGVKK